MHHKTLERNIHIKIQLTKPRHCSIINMLSQYYFIQIYMFNFLILSGIFFTFSQILFSPVYLRLSFVILKIATLSPGNATSTKRSLIWSKNQANKLLIEGH